MGGHSQLDKLIEMVRDTFLQNIPTETWICQSKPTVKPLRDKFRALLRRRRTADRTNAAASGIAEDLTEVDQLLDDLIKNKTTEEEDNI